MTTSIALIGAGMMGAPMAHRLIAASFAVTVCDLDPAALAPFAGTSARTTTAVADCASADVVLVLVAKDAQVERVVSGPDGLLAGSDSRPGVVVVMSTVTPDLVRSLAVRAASEGVQLLDAPISGGETGARDGTLSILAGGETDVLDGLAGVFSALGTTYRCGGVGAGSAVKVVNNLMAVVNAFVGAEAYRIALDNGLDLRVTGEVVEASSGRNFTSMQPGPIGVYERWTQSREHFGGLTSIMKKDLGLARSLADEAQGDYPLVTALAGIIRALDDDHAFSEWRSVADASR